MWGWIGNALLAVEKGFCTLSVAGIIAGNAFQMAAITETIAAGPAPEDTETAEASETEVVEYQEPALDETLEKEGYELQMEASKELEQQAADMGDELKSMQEQREKQQEEAELSGERAEASYNGDPPKVSTEGSQAEKGVTAKEETGTLGSAENKASAENSKEEKKEKEKPEEKPKEDAKEKPEEKPKEDAKEKPEEKPKEDAKEKPEEKPKEDAKEKPEEKPKEDAKEKPEEKPKEDAKETPEEKPKEQSQEGKSKGGISR